MVNEITKLITKIIKLGMRGVATIFIPILFIPVVGNFLGFGMGIQCGLLIKVPLIFVWIQTAIAWTDNIMHGF